MRSVIRDNGGLPPYDLDDRIDERFEKVQKHLSDKFKNELKRSLTIAEQSQGSSGLLTGVAHVAGKTVRNLPKAASGAVIGSKLGGIPGAVAGGLAGLSGLSARDLIG